MSNTLNQVMRAYVHILYIPLPTILVSREDIPSNVLKAMLRKP